MMMNRIIEYDSDLVFAHMVLKSTHDTLTQKALNHDPIVQLDQERFDILYRLSETFCEKIEKDENFYDVLKEFSVLTYSTGGNGYYSAYKGVLKI